MSTPTPNKPATAGMFTRYRSMIVLIASFLVVLSAVMISSILLSRQVNEHNKQYTVAESMHTAYLKVMQSLLSLKLNYGEDPNSPHIAHTLAALKENRIRFESSINALLNGGEHKVESGATINISAFDEDPAVAQELNKALELWKPLVQDIDEYLKTATSPTGTSVNLDLAVLKAQGSTELTDESIVKSLNAVQAHLATNNNALTWLQTTGIVGALGFFVIFIFYSIRKLFASDLAAEAARQETTEIMDTVSTGLFLLDRDLNLGSQYSKHLEKLLGQSNLGQRNLLDILGGMISDDDLNTTNAFIGQLYNPRTKERLIGSLNPLNRQPVMVKGSNGKQELRYLDFAFNRVYHEKEIARVLVNVSDVTDAVLLEQKIEQEREQNDVQLEMLSTILQADRRMINEFVRSIKRRNTNINNTLKSPGERQSELLEKVQTIFREVHSLKGEASTLKLHGFTVMAENLETELNKLSKTSGLSGENFLSLAVHLEELMRLTQTIEELVQRLGNSDISSPSAAAPAKQNTVADFYNQFVGDLAKRNGKNVDFSYVGIEETKHEETDATIREIAVQLLRNAVVHGIETPEQRTAARKLAAGHVRMELLDNGSGAYTLTLEDDGKGIDYEAIRAKAVRIGQYSQEDAAKLGQKELLSLIFSSGFSTLDQSTEDAGRGVGLDIIKDRVVALGGKIGVATHAGAYTRFSFTFPKKY